MTDKIGSEKTMTPPTPADTFWRVEGSLLNLDAVRPVAFFTWNAQSFLERWVRRGGLAWLALLRPVLYASHRSFATRVLHALLRGVTQDRLDFLGEEYFQYVLKPRLNRQSVDKLKELIQAEHSIVLVSQGLDHVMRPLADFLGVDRLIANRLDFRNGVATGRLVDPVIRPRGGFARLARWKTDGRIAFDKLAGDLGLSDRPEVLREAIIPAKRSVPCRVRPVVVFENHRQPQCLSVREALAGKHILLIGSTGFIGKVWLVKVLTDLPEIGKVSLLIRRQGSMSALRRFEKIVEESPIFDPLHERHGSELAKFIGDRVEIIEGDVIQPDLGIEAESLRRLTRTLDLVVNSSGLVDFNPDLRTALATNVDGTMHMLDFIRRCDHAGLLHLSTCYVVGARDGRVTEELQPNYTPAHLADFDAEREWQKLYERVRDLESQSESHEVTEEVRQQVLEKHAETEALTEEALEHQIRKVRSRWLRDQLVEAGMRRAKELGWPNTYTFTKSLSESLIAKVGADLPIAVVRPSIVESSMHEPFQGWNEGVNTSAPISYLMGTYFRQLPSNERKCLDLIPVDLVCRGMVLIAAAIVERGHGRLYQLATSASNPCDMGRSIELTSLAHRKHYRAQEGLESWLRARLESIPVSKARYETLSVPSQKAIVRALVRISGLLPFMRSPLVRAERFLERAGKIIELYEPFILYNEHVFEAENVRVLSEALPPEERESFGYDPFSIDWWEYWINIHIPALRRWSYPLIEGRPLETRPRRVFQLSTTAVGGAASATRQ
jgi:thioester reductase-like protein